MRLCLYQIWSWKHTHILSYISGENDFKRLSRLFFTIRGSCVLNLMPFTFLRVKACRYSVLSLTDGGCDVWTRAVITCDTCFLNPRHGMKVSVHSSQNRKTGLTSFQRRISSVSCPKDDICVDFFSAIYQPMLSNSGNITCVIGRPWERGRWLFFQVLGGRGWDLRVGEVSDDVWQVRQRKRGSNRQIYF